MPPRQSQLAFIVLAAGLGSRLSSVHSGQPKWMVPVDDETTVALHQLAALEHAVAPEAPRIVVSGAHADAVNVLADQWAASGKAPFTVLHNDRFAEWNNWYSLLLGLRHLDDIGWNGPTLVINGDLFCPPAWFSAFAATADEWAEIALAVDSSQVPSEEAMKVELSKGHVSAIGKVGILAPYGEYIGLGGLSAFGRKRLLSGLEALEQSGATNDWYEGGIRIAIAEGASVEVWDTPHQPWVEIDDEVDLAKARRIAIEAQPQAS